MATKRRATSVSPESTGTSKKPKIVPSDFRWEWEDDGQVWKPYSQDISDQISEALKGGHNKTTFVLGNSKFNVIFLTMVQRNAKTSWERRIRLRDSSAGDVTIPEWEWLDEHSQWQKYAKAQNELIYAGGNLDAKLVCFKGLGQLYEINIAKSIQKNKTSNTIRKIRKIGEAEDDVNPTAPVASTSKTVNGISSKQVKKETVKEEKPSPSKEDQEPEVKSISFKGKIPVDQECPVKKKYHVYLEGEDIWDAMLNQTNLKNNNNKYYLLQLLEDNNSKNYAVWFRWGRVGKSGQNSLFSYGGDIQEAKDTFTKKFYDKTLNEWESRHDFEKVAGKYDLLQMDYGSSNKEEDKVDGDLSQTLQSPESLLDIKIKKVIEMICNIQNMEDVVMEMKYDAKKAPLGKLTKEQITAGYTALKKIEAHIQKKTVGDKLIQACDEFYTRIPHCFGMKRPPVIRTKEEVLQKLELLEALGDIEIAMKVLAENEDMKLHPLDRHYKALNCELEALDHNTEEFKVVEQYLQNTHAPTHNHYKMEVEEVFICKNKEQEEQFQDYGNRYLLWHGSRLTNWVGILKQGLRVAPPEAPVTGYMFGKGIYFADMSSKSANYCFATKKKNIGFLLLSEVSLGKANELIAADYEADQLPSGCHSVKGLGKMAPLTAKDHTMSDGVVVPLGKATSTGVTNQSGYTLNYNEFVVYDTKQVKSRYLIQVKFNFT